MTIKKSVYVSDLISYMITTIPPPSLLSLSLDDLRSSQEPRRPKIESHQCTITFSHRHRTKSRTVGKRKNKKGKKRKALLFITVYSRLLSIKMGSPNPTSVDSECLFDKVFVISPKYNNNERHKRVPPALLKATAAFLGPDRF